MLTLKPFDEPPGRNWGSLSPEATGRLLAYSETLLSLGVRLGLSHLSPAQAFEQIERSLALTTVVFSRIGRAAAAQRTLIDVGSGSGLPLVPLAVSLTDQLRERAPRFVAIEPKRKAVAFLEKVFRDLGLPVLVVSRSAEEAAKTNIGLRGDFVTAKALAQPRRAVELCAPLCKIGGHIVITGKSGAGGLPEALTPDILSRLGLAVPETVVAWSPGGASQRIHLLKKESGSLVD